MTLNNLLRQAQTIAGQLSGGDVPMRFVGLNTGEDADMHFNLRTYDDGEPFVEVEFY